MIEIQKDPKDVIIIISDTSYDVGQGVRKSSKFSYTDVRTNETWGESGKNQLNEQNVRVPISVKRSIIIVCRNQNDRDLTEDLVDVQEGSARSKFLSEHGTIPGMIGRALLVWFQYSRDFWGFPRLRTDLDLRNVWNIILFEIRILLIWSYSRKGKFFFWKGDLREILKLIFSDGEESFTFFW